MQRIKSEQGVIPAESKDPYNPRDPVHLKYHRRNRRPDRMSGQIRMRVRVRDCIAAAGLTTSGLRLIVTN